MSTTSAFRAGDEARTRDLQLGRLPLYQLSYSRSARRSFSVGGQMPSHEKEFTGQVTFAKASATAVGEIGFEPMKS